MTISITCDTCGRGYRLKDEAGGKSMRCKDCREIMEIPAAGEPTDSYAISNSFDDGDWNAASIFGDDEPVRPPSPRTGSAEPNPTTRRRRRRRRPSGGVSVDGTRVVKILAGVAAAVVAFVVVGGFVRNGNFSLPGSYSWRDYQPPGVPVSLQLPGEPTAGTQFQAGMSMTTQMIEYRWPERVFGVMYAPVFPPPGAELNPHEMLQEARAGMVTGIPGARIVSDGTVTLSDDAGNSHPAIELIASFPFQGRTIRGYYRMALAGNYLVIAMCGALDSNAQSHEADFRKCLDSLRIVGNLTPPAGGQNQRGVPETNRRREPIAVNPPPIVNRPEIRNQPRRPEQPQFSEPPTFRDSGEDFAKRARENHERFVRESQERFDQMRREHEQRMEDLRNRSRNFGRNR